MIRLCFVCLGNICRSPTAEGVMRHLIESEGLGDVIALDSAGTGAYHVGESPDSRSTAVARERGIRLHGAARQFRQKDFGRFDYVLAMDRDNYRSLVSSAHSAENGAKVHMFRSFDPESPADAEVPDPYYGGERGFEDVLDICEAACRGLLDHVRREHNL